MDRITGRLRDGTAYVTSETGEEGVGFATTQRRLPEIVTRLAAYEDTGYSPAEFDRLCREMSDARMVLGLNTGADLMEAVFENRARILPCKIGDYVWVIRNFKGTLRAQEGKVSEMFFMKGMKLCIVVSYIARGEWGKTIFPTKEEAEKAIALRK